MSFSVERMALYNLSYAENTIKSLEGKPQWQPDDTASFDCMHYLGDAAIENCAKKLKLQPAETVVDIGSGFNATGRYLNKHHGAEVTGIELQPRIDEIGKITTERNGQSDKVHGICTNFLTAPSSLIQASSADHIVSFLCFLHIPTRADLFSRVVETLKPGGQIYIEDFYSRKPLTSDDAQALHDIVSCPYLPTEEQYVSDLKTAGFVDITFEDVSAPWSEFVGARAEAYHANQVRGPDMDVFYSTVSRLFKGGNLGGVRVHAHRST